MSQPLPPPPPPRPRVERLLADLHSTGVEDLEELPGGFWSSAWAYRADGHDLVLRLGTVPEGFAADVDAQRHRRPGLPIPRVLAVGEAFDGFSYAVSERARGRFLETVGPDEADVVGPTIASLLAALRSVPEDERAGDGRTAGVGAAEDGWRAWLRAGLVDDPSSRVGGWRRTLAADPSTEALFRACEARIDDLLDACPERRDLIHSDLLHRNVLVNQDASEVTAVFSWKCATRGDFLYDVAWCTFWSAWYPGIAAADVGRRVLDAADPGDQAFVDAAVRHHCYELQIGASHLGWYVWTDDRAELSRCADRLGQILERGI